MSKRYYVCDIIGDGSEDNSFRPAVADLGVKWVGSIPSDPVTGMPLQSWAMTLVATDNHARLRSDARIDALPDFPLDGRMNAINNEASSALSAALSRRGIDVAWGGTNGYRQVLQGIGAKNNPAFNLDKFDVAE